jgi:hypothetical protein
MKKFLAKSQTVSSDAPMGKTCLRPFWRSHASSLSSASALTLETYTPKNSRCKERPTLAQLLTICAELPASKGDYRGNSSYWGLCITTTSWQYTGIVFLVSVGGSRHNSAI